MPNESLPPEFEGLVNALADAMTEAVWIHPQCDFVDGSVTAAPIERLISIQYEAEQTRLAVEALLACQRALAIKELGFDPVEDTEYGRGEYIEQRLRDRKAVEQEHDVPPDERV